MPDLPSTPHFVALATRVGWDESQSFVATPPKDDGNLQRFVSDLERHGNVESFDKNIPFKGSTKKRFTINYLQFDLVGIPLTSLF